MSRLRGFTFALDRGSGETSAVIFYATNAKTATSHAEAWARERGYKVRLIWDAELAS